MLRVRDLNRQRDEAHRDRAEVEQRLKMLSMDSALPGVINLLFDGSLPASPTIDHRPRNAALGTLAGLPLFLLAHLALRAWRTRRRVVYARTAFPLITREPKPAVPIPADGPPDPAAPAHPATAG